MVQLRHPGISLLWSTVVSPMNRPDRFRPVLWRPAYIRRNPVFISSFHWEALTKLSCGWESFDPEVLLSDHGHFHLFVQLFARFSEQDNFVVELDLTIEEAHERHGLG